ncbi:MAG TPA: hypothetical protein VFR55_07510, partial [Dehalococcoidia bacterium]|nr:hypothetical protein [Dehalococcoidia bacterium]
LKYVSDAFEELHNKLQKELAAGPGGLGRVPGRECVLGSTVNPLVQAPGRLVISNSGQGY